MKPDESSTVRGQILHLDPKDRWKPIDYIRNIVFFVLRHPIREDILRTSLDNLIRNHLPVLGSKIQSDGKQGGLVTNGDIVAALLLKLTHLHRKKPKMIMLTGTVNGKLNGLRGRPTRFNAQIMCKAEGGYWCDFTSSTKNMALVDQLMSVDPSLESI
ncbi:hypothetical protein CGCSCA5_v007439 [Colletotrichum siamense]|nr:hypothetical protein CGCSCA5_v007439 [Colletotrichum siamense]